MNLTEALLQLLGSQVQVVTAATTFAGILEAVSNNSITINTSQQYGPTEQVTIVMDAISFVRVFSF